MIRGLIFDFDGLILETEGPDYQSWRELYEEYGCSLPDRLNTWWVFRTLGARHAGSTTPSGSPQAASPTYRHLHPICGSSIMGSPANSVGAATGSMPSRLDRPLRPLHIAGALKVTLVANSEWLSHQGSEWGVSGLSTRDARQPVSDSNEVQSSSREDVPQVSSGKTDVAATSHPTPTDALRHRCLHTSSPGVLPGVLPARLELPPLQQRLVLSLWSDGDGPPGVLSLGVGALCTARTGTAVRR